MLQYTIRKMLWEAETAFGAMTFIETFATENKLPYPVKVTDYVQTLFTWSTHVELKDLKSNKIAALLELNFELHGHIIQ